MWLDLGKPSMYVQKLKSILFAYRNGHTQALSWHSNKIAIDKKVCFYRWLFPNPTKQWKANTVAGGPLRGTNKVTCGASYYTCLLHTTYGMYMVCLWMFYLLTWHTTWPLVSSGRINLLTYFIPPTSHALLPPSLPHPPTLLYMALVMLQVLFQTISKQHIQPTAAILSCHNGSYCSVPIL